MENTGNGTLRLIAVFKLFKAVALIFVGISALKLVHGDAVTTCASWISTIGLNPDGRYVDKALAKVAGLQPSKFKELGVGSFVYSALFLTEGVGLWLQKGWAEWFTVAITGSLIPLEIYELHRQATVGKAMMLLINVGVLVYLLLQIRAENPARNMNARAK